MIDVRKTNCMFGVS